MRRFLAFVIALALAACSPHPSPSADAGAGVDAALATWTECDVNGCIECDRNGCKHPDAGSDGGRYKLFQPTGVLTWPNKQVLTCYNTAASDYGNVATWDPIIQNGVYRTWTQATGLAFVGFAACPVTPLQRYYRINLIAGSAGANSALGYNPTPGFSDVNLGTARGCGDFCALNSSVPIHEFGHGMSFAHESHRDDWPSSLTGSCASQGVNPGEKFDTPYGDINSIMVGTNYCQDNPNIDYWDVVGSQRVYGRQVDTIDVDGDGKSDLLLIESNGQVFVRLSTGSAFAPATLAGSMALGNKGTFPAYMDSGRRADLVLANDDGVSIMFGVAAASDGRPYFPPPSRPWLTVPLFGELGMTYTVDVTGDGIGDALAFRKSTFAATSGVFQNKALSASFRPVATRWTSSFAFVTAIWTGFGDVNADGKPDYITVLPDGSIGVQLTNSTATGFGTMGIWLAAGTTVGTGRAMGCSKLLLTDFFCHFWQITDTGFDTYLSNGTNGFGPVQHSPVPTWGVHGTLVADFNGDTLADVAAIGATDVQVYLATSVGTTVSFAPAATWSTTAFFSGSGLNIASECSDHIQDNNETAVDCGGGRCIGCALGQRCLLNRDCSSGTCQNYVCTVPPLCFNGLQDYLVPSTETDVDCGGSTCVLRCAVGQHCLINSDCASGSCVAAACH